jgi:hypothetical protein
MAAQLARGRSAIGRHIRRWAEGKKSQYAFQGQVAKFQ